VAETVWGECILTDSEARFQHLADKVRQRGGRLTPQRVAILRILALSEGHPSVEQLYEQIKDDFPTTGIATIYKTIALLKEMDEVLELGFADGSSRYDGARPAPHPHLICSGCGEILDLDVPALDELVAQVAAQLAETVEYDVQGHRFDLYGLCKTCRAAGSHSDRTE
jgi:Fur family peroxide stress response transcriptional regulator